MNTPNPVRPLAVLVVDDDEMSRDIMREMLLAMGVDHIVAAADGGVALEQLALMTPAPDYVICDVFMPRLDGIELLQALAQQKYAGGVVIVSGGDTETLQVSDMIARGNGLKVLGALIKPVAYHQMAQVLRLDS